MKKYYYLIVAALLLLASCSHEKSDWQNAKKQNDIQTYEQFISKHPQSPLKDSASIKIEELYFKDALKQNNVQTYQQFIGKYPKSIFKDSVNNRIRKIEFTEIYNKKDILGIKRFISNYSNAIILNDYQIKNPTTIATQSTNVNKGCKFILKELNDNEFNYLLTIPPNTSFTLDNISVGLDANVHVIKGDLIATISNGGTSGYKSTSAGNILSITLNKKNYLKLSSEFIEIMPNLLIYLDKSEFIISGKDTALLKRDVSQNDFYIEKGNIYYFKL